MSMLGEAAAWRRAARIIRREVAKGLDPAAYWRVGICHTVDELEQDHRISGETHDAMKAKLRYSETPRRRQAGYWWPNTVKGCEKRIAFCLARADEVSK